jgi:hypothetical protein
MPAKDPKDPHPDLERVALAIFALLAAEREERTSATEPRTVEAVLGAIGFAPAEVQALTGGNRKTITSRMRKAKST